MKVGIIDIGSNTIKAFVYEVRNDTIETLEERYIYAYLMSHIQNNNLDQQGIQILLDAGEELYRFLKEIKCDSYYAFATSAMRDAGNSEEIRKQFYEKVRLPIELLSEEDEARYDAVSLQYFSGKRDGIGLDLGGGSGQIFSFQHGNVTQSVSLPIGVLRTKNRIVKGDFPSVEEREQIDREIKQILQDSGYVNTGADETLCIMGGTAVTLFTVLQALGVATQADWQSLNVQWLSLAWNQLLGMGDAMISFLEEYAPGRVLTTLPGIAVLSAIASYFNCRYFAVFSNGVREGYLIEKERILQN